MQREPNTEYILSLSYGKDSLACLEAIKQLGYPLDRIVHAEVWATDTIPADLPPMIDFKAHADKIIKERYGYTVEHVCAVRGVTNDECGFVHHWAYELNFGKCATIQMIMGKNGEAVAIETIEDLWRLLNSEE